MADVGDLLRIGELAELAGTSTRALRYYEEHGLLTPARLPNGYRGYDRGTAVQAANIQLLLRTGLPMADVRDPHAQQRRPDLLRHQDRRR